MDWNGLQKIGSEHKTFLSSFIKDGEMMNSQSCLKLRQIESLYGLLADVNQDLRSVSGYNAERALSFKKRAGEFYKNFKSISSGSCHQTKIYLHLLTNHIPYDYFWADFRLVLWSFVSHSI